MSLWFSRYGSEQGVNLFKRPRSSEVPTAMFAPKRSFRNGSVWFDAKLQSPSNGDTGGTVAWSALLPTRRCKKCPSDKNGRLKHTVPAAGAAQMA